MHSGRAYPIRVTPLPCPPWLWSGYIMTTSGRWLLAVGGRLAWHETPGNSAHHSVRESWRPDLPASRNPKSKTLNTNSVIFSDSGINLVKKVVWLCKTTQIVTTEVQSLSPFASSGRTSDIMPVRARFCTVESKHVDHNTHACTCSMTQNVNFLLAHALSHQ
jgi:hypothetical protein